ncbi:hypothetical protein PAEPH01_0176 [Pancytospora epiphaga]|nr:hypothetical protein PAEPH01_0176 [Pancytospora epiphaga]
MKPLPEEIEAALKDPEPKNQVELRNYMQKTRSMIDTYEQSIYEDGRASEETAVQIKRWRGVLIAIIRKNRHLPEDTEEAKERDEEEDDKAGVEILKLMNQQLHYASNNQRLLERGTLKLVGLDYSYDEIEREVRKTRKRVSDGRNKELTEKRNLGIAFVIFISVCLFVLVDKFKNKVL